MTAARATGDGDQFPKSVSVPDLSVVIPVYDDREETVAMVEAVRKSISEPVEVEFLIVELRGRAPSLPAVKNEAAAAALGDYILFLYPGIFPAPGSIERLLSRLRGASLRHPPDQQSSSAQQIHASLQNA